MDEKKTWLFFSSSALGRLFGLKYVVGGKQIIFCIITFCSIRLLHFNCPFVLLLLIIAEEIFLNCRFTLIRCFTIFFLLQIVYEFTKCVFCRLQPLGGFVRETQ